MVTDNHYRWDFIQLSTDTKPTPATSPKVVNGSTLYTSDNSKLYVWYKDQWYEKTATGGGGTTYTAGDGITIENNTISADLAQTGGSSTTKIMSQKAVTDFISGAKSIKLITDLPFNYPENNPDGYIISDLFSWEDIYYANENSVKLYYSENDYINFSGYLQIGLCDFSFDEYEIYTYGFTITKLNGTSNTPEIYVGQTQYIPEHWDEELEDDVPASWTSLSFEQVGGGAPRTGRDLTNVYTIEELSTKVSSGDFSGLNIGDYITKTVKVGSNQERELDFVIADFDYFYGMGDQGNVYTHHLVLVPDTTFFETAQMNSSNTTSTGYYGSEMHGICTQEYTAGSGGSLTNVASDYEAFLRSALEPDDGTYTFVMNSSGKWELNSEEVGTNLTAYGITYTGTPVEGDTIALTFAKGNLEPFRQAIYTAFGESHILSHREYMSTSASSGTWHTARVELMNENMVYGQIIRANNYFGDMFAKTSLALFRNEPYRAVAKKGKDGSRTNVWLSSISSTSAFCFVNSNGIAGAYNASGNYAVRPYFLFV